MLRAWSGAVQMLRRGPKIMQIPQGYQKETFIA